TTARRWPGFVRFDMQPNFKPMCVMGIGNVLLGDDAIGPHVIAWLEAHYEFGSDVELCDAGTPGLDMMARLSQTDALVAVDAVNANAPAGSILLWDREALMASGSGIRVSPHDPALAQALATLELAGSAPAGILLVGIVPEKLGPGIGMSASVRAAVSRASNCVVSAVRQWGGDVNRRPTPFDPRTWWEALPAVRG
ncbi:MAG: hydrogenase maturation protease, partial [Myxococcota bacterium]